MRNIFFVLAIVLLIIGCSKEEQESKCNKVIIDSKQYHSSQSDPYQLLSLEIEGGCLKVRISYGGGCKEVSAKLIDRGNIAYSDPAQRNLKFVFTDKDECKALMEKDFYFDISDLQVDGTNRVQLIFQENDLVYIYEY